MKIKHALLTFAALIATAAPLRAAPRKDSLLVTDPAAAQRIAWWRDAKFGLFMHWGVYSVKAQGEWAQWFQQIPVSEYAKLADQFTAEKFDPNAWAAVAKSAGMKYVVLTSRHHDGFALFDDPGSDFTAMKSAAHRDFIADYTRAIRAAGLKVGLYYSPLDWRFPGFFFPDLYLDNANLMRDQFHRQLDELASNYGPIDLVWFDGGQENWLGFKGVYFNGGEWKARGPDKDYKGRFSWQSDAAVDNLRKKQPNVIINDRTSAAADFRSREGAGAIGDFTRDYPWELCVTINGAWGYRPGGKVMSLDDCLRLLVGTVGRDGNLLLNVGPMANGTIVPEQASRLAEIGQWLTRYGESIYATRGGPYMPGAYGVSTCRDDKVYLHLLRPRSTSATQPAGAIELPPLEATIKSTRCLTGETVSVQKMPTGLSVSLDKPSDAVDCVVELTLDRNAFAIPPIAVPAAGN